MSIRLGVVAFVLTLAVLGLGWRLFWQGPTECIEVPASDCAAVAAAARSSEWANNTTAYPSYDRADWRVMVDEATYVACWREGGGIICVGPARGADTL